MALPAVASVTAAWDAASAPRRRIRSGALGKLQLLQVGVGGSIAPADRHELKQHPDVAFTGFCDVDADALAGVAKDHPDAFTCRDFREAFDRYGDRFDAVVVCTPDHNHALVMLWALRANKHVYGQKPLVQQLSEVPAMLDAVAKRPALITQVGNQRMGPAGRQHAVDILRRGLLGKAVEAHVWISGPGDQGDGYFWYGGLKDPTTPPANLDWTLWLGAAQDAPYREGLVPLRWRSSWDYGTGQLGDWCTHLLDVLYFAYDLPAPVAVVSHTRTPSDFYHAQHVHSTLTYPVTGERFARERFVVHYCDKSQAPSRAALGLPAGDWPGIGTLVVCEGGVLLVEPEGKHPVLDRREAGRLEGDPRPGRGRRTQPLARMGRPHRREAGRVRAVAVRDRRRDGRGRPALLPGHTLPGAGTALGPRCVRHHEPRRGESHRRAARVPVGIRTSDPGMSEPCWRAGTRFADAQADFPFEDRRARFM
jgi:predicted dehydrogenase